MTKAMNPIVKIKAKTMWANLYKVNEMSNKYQVDLCQLSDSAVRALEDMGLSVRQDANKPEKGFFITVKSNHPIRAYDKDGNELKEVLVANGSEVTAAVSYYDWNWKNKKGRSASPVKLTIDKLIEYNPEAEEEDDMNDAIDDVL